MTPGRRDACPTTSRDACPTRSIADFARRSSRTGTAVARLVAAAASGEAPGRRRGASLRLAWAAGALLAVAIAAGLY